MDKVILYSSQVFLSEENTNPDSYIAKFIICDFGRNKNGVALDREHIEEWLATLNNKPLVGKIKMRYDGEYDFSGHNMKVVTKRTKMEINIKLLFLTLPHSEVFLMLQWKQLTEKIT